MKKSLIILANLPVTIYPQQRRTASLLVNGTIPAHQECPFIKSCIKMDAPKMCQHQGKDHQTDFVCSMARMMDMD